MSTVFRRRECGVRLIVMNLNITRFINYDVYCVYEKGVWSTPSSNESKYNQMYRLLCLLCLGEGSVEYT